MVRLRRFNIKKNNLVSAKNMVMLGAYFFGKNDQTSNFRNLKPRNSLTTEAVYQFNIQRIKPGEFLFRIAELRRKPFIIKPLQVNSLFGVPV